MSDAFLTNFMQAAHQIAHGERCIVLDDTLSIENHINVDADDLADASFTDLLQNTANDALNQNAAVITNNLITDPSQAPETNVYLSGLRMVVAIPLQGYGAVYMDQSIRKGVFDREVVDKLCLLGEHVINNGQFDLSSDNLVALYHNL